MAVHASQLTGDTGYIVIGGAGATVSSGSLGFKIVDNQLYGMSDATGTESTVLLGTIAAGTTYRLFAVVTSGTRLEFFGLDTTISVSLAIGFAM